MTKFEDNLSPYLTVVEQGSTPANPSSGDQKLFVRTSDHVLCYVNSSGTVTPVANAPGLLQSAIATRTDGDLTTSSTAFVDVTGVTVTLTTGAHRCLVYFNGSAKNDQPASNTCFDIDIDGTLQGGAYGLALVGQPNATDFGVAAPVAITYLTPVLTAGSHTIKVRWRVDGATGTLFASTAVTPAALTVIETGLTT